jgi:hypothetical protein
MSISPKRDKLNNPHSLSEQAPVPIIVQAKTEGSPKQTITIVTEEKPKKKKFLKRLFCM